MSWIDVIYINIKKKVTGLTVTDATSATTSGPTGTPVAVYFELPETEEQEQTFPHVIIHAPTQDVAHDREHRGITALTYVPEFWQGEIDDSDPSQMVFPLYGEYPLPYNFDFHIEVKCRLQDHAMQLISKLAEIPYFPPKFGYLEIPEDHTLRNLILLGGPTWDAIRDDDGKRLFVIHYMVRIHGEQVFLPETTDAGPRVTEIDLTFDNIRNGEVEEIVVTVNEP